MPRVPWWSAVSWSAELQLTPYFALEIVYVSMSVLPPAMEYALNVRLSLLASISIAPYAELYLTTLPVTGVVKP